MTTVGKSEILSDRTNELSFSDVDTATAEALLRERIIVMRGVLAPSVLGGVQEAFGAHRDLIRNEWQSERVSSTTLREIAKKALVVVGLKKPYTEVGPPEFTAFTFNPAEFPEHLEAAGGVVEAAQGVSEVFFQQELVLQRYGYLSPNIAKFSVTGANEAAIELHQDSQAITGLGIVPQLSPTVWFIHDYRPTPPAPVGFFFTTEPGDVVVSMEREGPCPDNIPFQEGSRRFYPDGSVLHSGLNFTGLERYSATLFHQEGIESLPFDLGSL